MITCQEKKSLEWIEDTACNQISPQMWDVDERLSEVTLPAPAEMQYYAPKSKRNTWKPDHDKGSNGWPVSAVRKNIINFFNTSILIQNMHLYVCGSYL